MKRKFIRLSIAAAIALVTTTSLQAQTADLAINRKAEAGQNYSSATTAVPSLNVAELKGSNPRMITNFDKNFPGATGVSWTKLNDGHQSTFIYNGRKARAVFSSHDELSYSIVEYRSGEVPVQVNSLLADNYSGYTVFSAQEVKASQGSCYHLVLENAKGYVNLKVAGDEIEEVSRISKKAK